MPFYEYLDAAGHRWEVAKRMADIDEPEACPDCGERGERQVTLPMGTVGAGDWNRQEWNPGLGCYTRGWKDAEKVAKAKGLEPVGNEKPEAIHKAMDKKRAETRAERWAQADREMKYG